MRPSIPRTVTARVVPSNVFAVSSVQLVDRGPDRRSPPGATIPEDTELPTVLFQTTISKLRDILAATGRGREDKTIGVLAAINAATENRRTELLASGAQLNRLVDQLDAIVATEPGPDDGVGADRRHAGSAEHGTRTARRAAPSRWRRCRPWWSSGHSSPALINGGVNTMGTTHTALNNHADRLVKITAELTPVLGQLADT